MLYRVVTVVCCETHTEHINKMCDNNVEDLNMVRVITTVL
jgi:hypothetical protein